MAEKCVSKMGTGLKKQAVNPITRPSGPVQVWHMSLDNTRNRTLQTNLTISIASFALMVATVPAAFFGMNLLHGWEVRPCMCAGRHAD